MIDWVSVFLTIVTAISLIFAGNCLVRRRRSILQIAIDARDSSRKAEALAEVNRTLEARISERTAELSREVEFRRSAEVALRKSETKYRGLFELAAVGMAFVEARSGRFIEVNRKYEQITGFSEGELQKLCFVDITHPEDRSLSIKLYYDMVDGKIPTYRLDKRYIRKDGRVVWVRLEGTLIGEGEEARTVACIQDVTQERLALQELGESEARFHQLADAMPQIAWTAGPDGEIDYFNARWQELTGMSAETYDRSIHQKVIHPEDLTRVEEIRQSSHASGQPYQVEIRLLDYRSGKYRWFLTRVVPVKDAAGAVTRWFGTSTDIEDMKRAQERLSEAVSARDAFLSIASHELKTPLTSLKIQTQMTRRNLTTQGEIVALAPPRMRPFIDQVDRLVHLVDDMLDISRISTGRLTIQKTDCQLSKLVREVVERMGPALAQVGCRLSLFQSDEIKGFWDPFRIEQVLTNLLTNAARYAAGAPVEVRVWRDGTMAHVSVRDHGRGIQSEDQAKIFERFARAVSASEISGMGLGLYISREILEAHGGSIRVESELGSGSTFTMSLPAG